MMTSGDPKIIDDFASAFFSYQKVGTLTPLQRRYPAPPPWQGPRNGLHLMGSRFLNILTL